MLTAVLVLLTPLALPSGASSAHPEILVVAHPSAPVTRLSDTELESIFTLSNRRWEDGSKIIPFNLPSRSQTRVVFDRTVLRMEPDRVSRFWLDRRIRGQGSAPRNVPSASLMARLIAKLPGSIGYMPATTPSAGARVIARIRGGKVVAP